MERSSTVNARPSIIRRALTRQESTVHSVALLASHKYETADYEEPDSEFLRRHFQKQAERSWMAKALEEAYVVGEWRIEQYVEYVNEKRLGSAVGFAIGTSLVSALIPSFLIIMYAPSAIGSGLTEIIAYLNGSYPIKGKTLRRPFLRYLGSFGIVLAGLYSGIDGPMSHIGASLAVYMARFMKWNAWTRSLFYGMEFEEDPHHVDNAGWQSLLSVLERRKLRVFATLGAAVTIAVIFRAPIGGVMFAIEEAMSVFEPSILLRTFFSTIIASLFFGHLVTEEKQKLTERHVKSTLFPINAICDYTPLVQDYFTYMLVGFCAAVVGTIWNSLLGKIQKFRLKYVVKKKIEQHHNPHHRHLAPNLTTNNSVGTNTINSIQKKIDPSRTPTRVAIRLLEVAVLCVVTNIIVVLLPLGDGMDSCIPLSETTNHVYDTTPESCWKSLNDTSETNFENCLILVDETCLPNELLNIYIYNIVRWHVVKINPSINTTIGSDETTSGDTTTTTTEALHRRSGQDAIINSSADDVSRLPPTVRAAHVARAVRNAANIDRRLNSESQGRNSHLSARTSRALTNILHPSLVKSPDNTDEHRAAVSAAGVVDINSTTDPDFIVPSIKFYSAYHLLKLKEHNEKQPNQTQTEFEVGESECFYPLRTLLYATPDKQLQLLMTRGLFNLFPTKTLLIFLAVYSVLSIATYYIALPTDIVIPNLILGAIIGRLIGLLVNSLRLDKAVKLLDPGMFAMIGMAALWSGTSRLALTVTVITFEMTGDFQNLPAVLVVTLTSAFVTAIFEHLHWGESLYHEELQIAGILYLPHEPGDKLRTMKIVEVSPHQRRDDIMYLKSKGCTVDDVRRVLRSSHNGFPVVDVVLASDGVEKWKPVGTISRGILKGLLAALEAKWDAAAANESENTVNGEVDVNAVAGGGVSVAGASMDSVATGSTDSSIPAVPVSTTTSARSMPKSPSMFNLKRNQEGTTNTTKSVNFKTTDEMINNNTNNPDDDQKIGQSLPPNLEISIIQSCNVSPLIVNHRATASKVYTLIKSLGARHVLVVDDENYLVAVITRRDFATHLRHNYKITWREWFRQCWGGRARSGGSGGIGYDGIGGRGGNEQRQGGGGGEYGGTLHGVDKPTDRDTNQRRRTGGGGGGGSNEDSRQANPIHTSEISELTEPSSKMD
ncbi:hypothetical protein HDU76_013737 [Blyttiomyces sp. JEL0837]|nr:hypothetical protein HDU76_013737 [Blyttiomyces sp. JEL0837]